MPPDFYERCDELAEWMEHSRESLAGAHAVADWQEFGDVPITRRAGSWYVHVLSKHQGDVVLREVPEPESARLLRDGSVVESRHEDGSLRIILAPEQRGTLDDVVVISWQDEPKR